MVDELKIYQDMATWFNTSEAAEYLSISKGQLLNLTSRREIPYYKLGRSNRYLKYELDRLLLSTKVGSPFYECPNCGYTESDKG